MLIFMLSPCRNRKQLLRQRNEFEINILHTNIMYQKAFADCKNLNFLEKNGENEAVDHEIDFKVQGCMWIMMVMQSPMDLTALQVLGIEQIISFC